MKKAGKILAWILAVILVFSVMRIAPVNAKAELSAGDTFTIKIGCQQDMQIPENYGVEYIFYNGGGEEVAGGGNISGSASGEEVSREVTIPEGAANVKITVTSAGNDIYVNGAHDDGWASGRIEWFGDMNAGQTYQFQLQPHNQGGSGGGEQGGEHGGNPPVSVDLTVSWTGDFGEINVGNRRVENLSANTAHFSEVNLDNDQIKVSIQANFTEVYSSIKIDGIEKLSDGETKDYYEFFISKETTSLSIEVAKGTSTQHTIVWAYDDHFGDDAKVEHGRVEMVAGFVSGGDGHYLIDDDSDVTIKLIPDYGYQVVGAKINGVVDLNANSATNEFTFTMPHTNVHFQGIFTRTADIVANSSAVVSSASFAGNAVATSGGTAKMTIASASPTSTSLISDVDDSKSVQAVDITMDQLFYKNSESDVWSTNKSELGTPAEVNLTVNQSAGGYAVLREHNGVVEEIPASYDATTNTITFASAKYSTYTLVPLIKSNNTYVPEEKAESQSDVITEEKEVEEENIKEIKMVSADKTALSIQTEQLIPSTSFNLSNIKSFRGFTLAVEKSATVDLKASIVSLYTEKPFCFNKSILNAMKNSNKSFVYYFMYKGHLYSVTIPAGTDASKVLEKNGYAGPFYVGKILGTTKFIK